MGWQCHGEAVYYGLTGGGLAALRIADGQRLWLSRFGVPESQTVNHGAAATGTPGAVFVGGADGTLNALASGDGSTLWQFNTNQQLRCSRQGDHQGRVDHSRAVPSLSTAGCSSAPASAWWVESPAMPCWPSASSSRARGRRRRQRGGGSAARVASPRGERAVEAAVDVRSSACPAVYARCGLTTAGLPGDSSGDNKPCRLASVLGGPGRPG